MPTYVYECNECGETDERFNTVSERHRPEACMCGGLMKKTISSFTLQESTFKPFEPKFNKGLGKFVSSQAEQRDEMKRQGVVERGY